MKALYTDEEGVSHILYKGVRIRGKSFTVQKYGKGYGSYSSKDLAEDKAKEIDRIKFGSTHVELQEKLDFCTLQLMEALRVKVCTGCEYEIVDKENEPCKGCNRIPRPDLFKKVTK